MRQCIRLGAQVSEIRQCQKTRTLLRGLDEVNQLLHEVGHLLYKVSQLLYEVHLLTAIRGCGRWAQVQLESIKTL